jgi:hypothetical protein
LAFMPDAVSRSAIDATVSQFRAGTGCGAAGGAVGCARGGAIADLYVTM